MFHSVPGDGPDSVVQEDSPEHSLAVFEYFLGWLSKRAKVLPLLDVVDRLERKRGTGSEMLAALTFDDGHIDNFTVVYPRLKAAGIPATFFIPSQLVGRPAGMSRDMVQEAARGGISIGSHSATHRSLITLSDPELLEELANSKAELQELTGLPCLELAYPYGQYDERARRLARSVGYKCAVSASPYGSIDDLFLLPRVTIPDMKSDIDYEIALCDAQRWRRRLGRIGWVDNFVHGTLGLNRKQPRAYRHSVRGGGQMSAGAGSIGTGWGRAEATSDRAIDRAG